jgi:hypothetical protein
VSFTRLGGGDRVAEATNVARLAAIDAHLTEIDKGLVAEFPDYAALAKPTPVSVEHVQAVLGSDETLVLFLDTPTLKPSPEETFIWVVTRTDVRWVRSELGTRALTREVAALRCGLDGALWDDDAASKRCRDLLRGELTRGGQGGMTTATLPFTARAHALYETLFGQVEDLIRGKHLLIVPSGPLTQLPFHVLVTAAPPGGDDRATQWLTRAHAITLLPAVSSLKALRRVAKPSTATKPILGIGNPLLDGDPTKSWEVEWARKARNKQACPQIQWQRVAGLAEKRRGARQLATRGGHPDLAELRTLVPLHDTADELCAVAKDLQLSPDDIPLGASATETIVKQLNLAQYRVVHFATHGIVAGQIEGARGPGLILTRPRSKATSTMAISRLPRSALSSLMPTG